MDGALSHLGVGAPALFSTLGRVAARGIETQVVVEELGDWVGGLADNMGRGDLRICDNSHWEPSSWPADCTGAGAARLARPLGAHPRRPDRQLPVRGASTWNAGPRDAAARRGPYEEALLGTPVANAEQPVEILRAVHSFDPCMACGVHVVDASGRERAMVRVS